MEHFLFSLNATLPIFLIIALGYLLHRLGWINEEFCRVGDKLVFRVALPVLLFRDIAKMDFYSMFDLTFVLFCMGATTVMFLATWGISWLCFRDKSQVGSFAMSSVRGSAAILGVALAEMISGTSGMAPLMIVGAVPLFNVYSVLILTLGAKDGRITRHTWGKIGKNIITNPIIIGIAAGLPFAIWSIPLPQMALGVVDRVGSLATPLALLVIGGTFRFSVARTRLRPAIIATAVKLLVLPAVFLPIAAYGFGFRDTALVSVFLMVASPTTVACYIMAKNMDNDAVLASNTVMLASLFSAVTVTLWVFLMRSLGLI